MSKTKEWLMSTIEQDYEKFVEEEKNVLRKEGAEEMRIEITRELKNQMHKAVTSQEKFGLQVALVVVTQASI
jgi:hypothetical protein